MIVDVESNMTSFMIQSTRKLAQELTKKNVMVKICFASEYFLFAHETSHLLESLVLDIFIAFWNGSHAFPYNGLLLNHFNLPRVNLVFTLTQNKHTII